MSRNMKNLSLGGIIERLKKEDPDRVIKYGFNDPHSYRGYYDQLAFEPANNITVREMLDAAEFALGATFEGYKGGEFTMNENTKCWIAMYGCTSDNLIGPILLELILGDNDE